MIQQRDVLEEMAGELQIQAGALDMRDSEEVTQWIMDCNQVLDAIHDDEARESHLNSFVICLQVRELACSGYNSYSHVWKTVFKYLPQWRAS